jgi:peptidoglycan-associated lipoprotein
MKTTPPLKNARRLPSRSGLGAAALVAALLAMAGCSSPVKLDEKAAAAPVETRSVTPAAPGNATGTASGVGQSNVAMVDLTSKQAPATQAASDVPRVVYFDFDSYVVRDEFRNVIEGNAKLLSTDRKKRVLIEGHTDERGGSEYNLALGQRRAEAVARSLSLLGVQDGQLEPVSFGKERPVATGSDEAAWAKNRRAELKERQ